ncbi:haloacid dehalogenase, type II [Sclerotinia borealis F-4128]|uniref:Haloacid dehalogenase, type II n=1 Tax=Sclerotinia borealis (strain F-4128) TaxID=1432307 RepID=W9C6U5_SCLBF|nr:haloacid dehalogenase, type II [Sclerotinia borealis F-4128]
MSNSKTVIAFDLYGTLLSTESIAKELAKYLPFEEKAQFIATIWRRYQLEYTFRMNSMSVYAPFEAVTTHALRQALSEHHHDISIPDMAKIMSAYNALSTFPDVEAGLLALAQDPDIDAYVFSNGSEAMVSASVTESPSLSVHAGVFKELITVQEVKCYKPDPRVYRYLLRKVGKAGKAAKNGDAGDVWLVSGNPFDIVGARACGLKTCWVARKDGDSGSGIWHDRMGEMASGGPHIIVDGVDEAVRRIQRLSKNITSLDAEAPAFVSRQS